PGSRFNERQRIDAEEQGRRHREEPVTPQPPGDEIDDADEQAAEEDRAGPPRPRVEPPPGDGRSHEELGQWRLRIEIRLRRLRQVLRRVDREVHLVEDVAAVIDLAVVRTDWDWSAFRGVVRMANAESAHAPGAVEEIGKDRARKTQCKGE